MSKIYIFQIPGKEDFAASISLEPLCNGDGINDYNYYQLAKKHATFLAEYIDASVTFFPMDNPTNKKTISFFF